MKIIFVCTGNTCRSPLAESIAKAKLAHYTIESRGLYANNGGAISTHSQAIINKQQLPQPSHTQNFTETDLQADLILTMSTTHKDTIRYMFGQQNHVFTIKEYAGYQGEVSDPFGADEDAYDAVFEELNTLIEKIKNKILTQ